MWFNTSSCFDDKSPCICSVPPIEAGIRIAQLEATQAEKQETIRIRQVVSSEHSPVLSANDSIGTFSRCSIVRKTLASGIFSPSFKNWP